MTVLLDTGVLYAFIYDDDARHGEAKDLFLRVAHAQLGLPFVADWAVAELFTLIRAHGHGGSKTEEAAHRLLLSPEQALAGLRILTVAPGQLGAVWKTYEKHRAKRISFTDAAQLVLLSSFGIDRLATFDRSLRGLAPTFPEK